MYINPSSWTYHNERFNKDRTVPAGYPSDGASGPAVDIYSRGWWVHDVLTDPDYMRWDDGTPCPNRDASLVLHDILMAEGRWIRARTWFVATYLWGEWAVRTGRRRAKSVALPAKRSRIVED